MAAAAAEKCRWCDKPRSSFASERGWRSHIGRKSCGRAFSAINFEPQEARGDGFHGETPLPQEDEYASEGDVIRRGEEDVEVEEPGDGEMDHEEDEEDADVVDFVGPYDFSPFESESDFQLARLYTTRTDLSKSTVDAVLHIAREGPFVASSAEELLRPLDALPGLLFQAHHVDMPGENRDQQPIVCMYRFFSRPMLACANWLLDRHGDDIIEPYIYEDHEPPEFVEELWQAERFQKHLRAFKLDFGHNPRNILLPLILFSDETCLTLFNTSSDQSTTYPMFMTLGTLASERRRRQDALVNVALLPKYLKRQHRGGAEAQAANKRRLTWCALGTILEALQPTEINEDDFVPWT